MTKVNPGHNCSEIAGCEDNPGNSTNPCRCKEGFVNQTNGTCLSKCSLITCINDNCTNEICGKTIPGCVANEALNKCECNISANFEPGGATGC